MNTCDKKYKCNQCKYYEKQAKKYKYKYKIAKSNLSNKERELIIELICNEQIKHLIAKNQYNSDKYNILERLKAKIRIV